MISGLLTLSSFLSVIFFPWPITALLALAASSMEPLVPLAVGLFADTLYYAPSEGAWPLLTFLGAAATAAALFLRSRLRTAAPRT